MTSQTPGFINPPHTGTNPRPPPTLKKEQSGAFEPILRKHQMLRNPKLTGQIFFGGLIQAGGPVKVVEDKEMSVQPQVNLHCVFVFVYFELEVQLREDF